jgi:hypothetical protein
MVSGAARADVPLDGIRVEYHGGALIQHVKIVPILYGSSWQGKPTATYLKGFLQTLMADGRYMANLAQYSAGGYQIGMGTTMDPIIDPVVLPKVDSEHAERGVLYQVTDDQIQGEIKALFTNGKVPPPDADTLYVVCTSSDVVVVALGSDSEFGFAAYHDYTGDGGYAYAVVCPTGDSATQTVNTPTGFKGTQFNRDLTTGITHELSEAVTDPQEDGWLDDNTFGGAEIADIPVILNALGLISDNEYYGLLTGSDGTKYVVVSVWSNRGETISSFAPLPSP